MFITKIAKNYIFYLLIFWMVNSEIAFEVMLVIAFYPEISNFQLYTKPIIAIVKSQVNFFSNEIKS